MIGAGYLGVDLFFLLSGFVLMRTYGGELGRFSMAGVRRFAIGRVFRILPLHWSVLAAFVTVMPFMAGDWIAVEPHSTYTFALVALLIQVPLGHSMAWNGPAWSLSAECVAYAALPFIAAVVTWSARRRSIAIALLVVLTHARGGSFAAALRAFGLLRCLCEFAAGAALCRACDLKPFGARTGTIM